MSLYLLDANVFIQAKRFSYPFDAFPGFWDWLEKEFSNKVIVSIKPIYNELTATNDDLSQWAKERKESGWFLNVDDTKTQSYFSEIASWAVNPKNGFKETAYEEFLNIADSWIIAKALTEGATIVTHEVFQAGCKKRILIPNVCKEFNIPYINTLELIRRTGAKFGLN